MKRKERGFGVVGMVVAIALAGIIAAGAGMTALQVIKGTKHNEEHARVTQQAHNLGRWFSRDALTAESISFDDNPDTDDDEFITICWKDWQSGETFTIQYVFVNYIDSLKQVKRNQVKHDIDGAVTENTTTLVADSIYSANVSQQDDTWILTVETLWGQKGTIQEYKVVKRLT